MVFALRRYHCMYRRVFWEFFTNFLRNFVTTLYAVYLRAQSFRWYRRRRMKDCAGTPVNGWKALCIIYGGARVRPAIRSQPTGKSLWGVSDAAPCRAYQSVGTHTHTHVYICVYIYTQTTSLTFLLEPHWTACRERKSFNTTCVTSREGIREIGPHMYVYGVVIF